VTRNESFKRRIRERMAHTGERYGAARRTLLEQADARAARAPQAWVSDPGHSDEVVRANTGRGWEDWRALIDAWPGHDDGHAAVASWLIDEHGVPGWWAQSVTVGWERITGRRLPHQVADGTFTANRSATVTADAEALGAMLRDEAGRSALFPAFAVELRSRVTSKNVRLGLPDGVVELALTPRDDGRVKVDVSHAKLAAPEEVAHWKAFWGDWLRALDDA
jgi:hypothetical protein